MTLVTAIAFVTSAQEALSTVAANLFLPLDYAVGQSTLATIILILLLALLLVSLRRQAGLGADKAGRRLYFEWARQFTPAAWVILAVSLVSLAAGYLALGQFLVMQLFETARLIACLYLLHRLADAAITNSFDPQSRAPGCSCAKSPGSGSAASSGSARPCGRSPISALGHRPSRDSHPAHAHLDRPEELGNTLLLGFHLAT